MDDFTDLISRERYQVEECLGNDTWGELFRAEYVPHGRTVLLRRFGPGLSENPDAWELLTAELQAWARLDHTGILQVFDWGEVGTERYMVTEYPEGSRLSAILDATDETRDPDTIFSNLLRSVEAARRWGVIHLGLNPRNVWVSEDDTVKLGEFGMWYVARDHPPIGARDDPFLAPEQIDGRRVSAATDVYALGMLYLALHRGFERSDRSFEDGAIPVQITEKREVIERCLDPQPLARYRSAGQLAEALGLNPDEWQYEEYRDCPICRLKSELSKELSSSQPVHGGRRPAAADASWRPRNQNPRVASYLWLALAALLILTILVWWVALR